MPSPKYPTNSPDAKNEADYVTSHPLDGANAPTVPTEPKKSKYTLRNRKPISIRDRTPYTSNPSDSGEGSEFEDEEGTTYVHKKNLGVGNSASGRLFKEKNKVDGKEVVILRPRGQGLYAPDMDEALMKLHFFQTLYPEHNVRLILDLIIDKHGHKTYRLILPLLPGYTYKELSDEYMTEEQKVKVFLSAINALEDCHAKKLIVLDLKRDNIHYDKITGKSYLIDGGHATQTSAYLDQDIYLTSKEKAITNIKTYSHIAPECWTSDKNIKVKANEAMDIYSLGRMMGRTIELLNNSPLNHLIKSCINQNPTQRPTLAELKTALLRLLPPEEAELYSQQLKTESTEVKTTPSAAISAQTAKPSTSLSSVKVELQQAKLFLSAIQALKKCHEDQLIVLDLQREHMRYDGASRQGYSIDSKDATKRGEKLNPNVYCLASPEAVADAQVNFPHIAPECWSSDEELDVLANEAMDIYSLGIYLKQTLAPAPDSLISMLINCCTHPEPTQRPGLSDLIIPLTSLLSGTPVEELKAQIADALSGPSPESSSPESEAGSDEKENFNPKP